MKLSVIIPVRNAGDILDGCLESFCGLSESIHEILLMDCCSTDHTELIVEKYSSNLRIRHFRSQDKGIYDAFNKGVAQATGDIIFFMGADDRVKEGLVNAITSFSEGDDILVGGITIDGQPEAWRPFFLGCKLLYRNIPHQGMIIRKTVVSSYPYSLRYPILGDYAWNLERFWSGVNYAYSREQFCEWAPGGVSGRSSDVQFESDKADIVNRTAPLILRVMYNVVRWVRRH